MNTFTRLTLLSTCALALFSCTAGRQQEVTANADEIRTGDGDSLKLPAPYATKSAVNRSDVIGWKDGAKPQAPEGFEVSRFAGNMKSVRWLYVLENGDVLAAQSGTRNSPDKITLLRDSDHDGIPETMTTFLEDLNQPFGMLVLHDRFYVANTDGLWVYPYENGATRIEGEGKKILDLPAGGYNNHWTRNLLASPDGSKIYISVGSGSNVGEHGMEHEKRRANILQINPDGSGEVIYASGLRNPVGMGWAPGTNTLWTAVNERDELGDNLVPDFATSVKKGGFYGWPYSYYGAHKDPRFSEEEQRPELVQKAIVPDVSLGAHTASLGLAFCTVSGFPEKYQGGMFIGQHGSWNRSELAGYKVVFVPFKAGKPSGEPEDFLTGFIANADESEVYGRPVGVTFLPDGSMLVADDAGDVIWRVRKLP